MTERPEVSPNPRWRLAVAGAVSAIVLAVGAASAQTMPAPPYHDLIERGHPDLAEVLARRLDLRSFPDRKEVEDFLDEWNDRADGPSSGFDWLAVTRLWLRSGDADRAESALRRADGGVPEGYFLLERARIAFLRGDSSGARDYWVACAHADGALATEMWLDVEVLATPEEMDDWSAFRSLPPGDRDECAFFRRFWNRRAAASALEVDERMLEHYERVRYALRHYRRRGRVRPRYSVRLGRPANSAFDDRGLLHIRMGQPDDVAAHLGSGCIEPNMSWAYDRPEGFRVYHLSPLRGADDWYLLENLAMVYSCGSPLLIDVPGRVLYDLYLSRMHFDPRYAKIANDALNSVGEVFAGLQLAEDLADERARTWDDAEYAVRTVPERPAVDPGVDFALEWLQFRAARPGLTRVWLNALVDGTGLWPGESSRGADQRVGVVWTLLNPSGSYYRRLPVSMVAERPSAEEPALLLNVRVAADLPPGEYQWTVVVADGLDGGTAPEERPRGGYARGELFVRDLGSDVPVLSNVAVSSDSLGSWSPAPGIALNPSPAHATGPDGVAFLYYEAYNLTPGGRYETRVVLEPSGGGEPFDLSYPGTARRDASVVTRGYLRVDLSKSGPGRYVASVSVRDLTSGHVTLPVRTEIVAQGD